MNWEWRTKLVVMTVALLAILFVFYNKEATVYNQSGINNLDKTGKLLRLQVVANSNSPDDQHLKRQVKEQISNYATQLFRGQAITSPQEVIRANKKELQEIIARELEKRGVDYGVEFELGESNFPTRSYGNKNFAAGKYQSLQVVLGSGQGQNWWCVLFPPLCFVDSMGESSEDDLEELIKATEAQELSVEYKIKSRELVEENPELLKSKSHWIQILKTSFPRIESIITPDQGDKQAD